VTKRDYISFFKTITSPIDVNNAVAWGEQEENTVSGSPVKKMFNIVLFSVLGSLYDVDSDIHQVKMNQGNAANNALSAAVLDEPYTPYSSLPSSYFNIMVRESIVDQINQVNNLSSTSKIKLVLNKLNTRSEITVKNIYITPIINEFDLVGTVRIKKLSNINFIQKNINNKLYEFFNLKADFDVPVYLSNLIEIIESDPNVVYTDINFVPYATSGVEFNYNANSSVIVDSDISGWTPVGLESIPLIENVFVTRINQYVGSRTSFTFSEIKTLFTSATTKNVSEIWNDNFTERNFYNELCKNIYSDLKLLASGATNGFADSDSFANVVLKMRNSFDYAIKFSQLDALGNIVNYSMSNQIAKVRIQLTYVYK
jgi:hypothetical protein